VETSNGVWQHSTLNRERAQSRGGKLPMETYPVEVEPQPTFHDGAFLEDQLYAYNVKQTGV
jgi:hypothetical protein